MAPEAGREAPDLEQAIAALRDAARGTGDRLALGHWRDEDWRSLLEAATLSHVAAGEALIRRGVADRTVYLVLRGEVEVMADAGDGMSMGRIARVGPGGVVGEQSFFDGAPRSAGAWALGDGDVAALAPEQFALFAAKNPALACDLLFAFGALLAVRLRRTTAGLPG
jgi:CRP/FNR family transcriptional regulator, cyclic AMP receptor protein